MKSSTLLIVVCAVVTLFCAEHAAMAQVVMNATSSVVSSRGTGTVTIPADIAQVQLGVEAQSDNATQAQADAASTAQDIVTALQALNVSKLQTSSITLTQITLPTPTPVPFMGQGSSQQQANITFSASNIVSFQVPADQAGEAIDAAVAAGANTIDSVLLIPTEANVTAAQQEATRLAVANGIAYARLVVSELGCQIVGVGSVELNPVFTPISASTTAASAIAQGATTPVLAGEVDITATVDVNLFHQCPSAAIDAINNATFPNSTSTA